MAQARLYDAKTTPNQVKDDLAQTRGPDGITHNIGDQTEESPVAEDYWLMVARDAFEEAESYFDANVRKQLQINYAHFGNRHAPGSKYHKNEFAHRSKGFRPKTRSMVRKNEANAAVALFSTTDVVNVEAARSKQPNHQISAEINRKLLQYRLENTIPWYMTAIGAYQEANNTGICISHQYWNYSEAKIEEPMLDDQGMLLQDEEGRTQYSENYMIVKDTPAIDLRPIENVYFHPAADWRDPIGTSPYIIDQISMTIDDVMLMVNNPNSKIPWHEITEEMLTTAVTTDYDAVRNAREKNREDSKDQRHLHRGFDTVWIHRNIIRKDGRDWIFYTADTYFRMSDPIPLTEEYPHCSEGDRPYKMGFANIEAHKTYPDSLVSLVAGTQQRANDLDNQRFDNVKLSLNRRYIVKRSAMIDYGGLQRNVPGGVTEADDPNTDVRVEAPPDVTSSSYQEQDRINADFDEIAGTFSPGSVSTNRQMNETVGGMELLAGNADSITEYPLRTFVETWVKPVLKELIKLEQTHESDPALLTLIGEDMEFYQKTGVDRVTDLWIQGSMNVQVNVGFGSTNPQQRVNRIATGLQTIAGFAPDLLARLDADELATEVLGALGFSSADRFFPPEKEGQPPAGPEEGALTEQDQAQLDQQAKVDQAKMDLEMAKLDMQMDLAMLNQETELYKLRAQEMINEAQFEQMMAKLQVDRQNKVDEMKLKLKMGTGI